MSANILIDFFDNWFHISWVFSSFFSFFNFSQILFSSLDIGVDLQRFWIGSEETSEILLAQFLMESVACVFWMILFDDFNQLNYV